MDPCISVALSSVLSSTMSEFAPSVLQKVWKMFGILHNTPLSTLVLLRAAEWSALEADVSMHPVCGNFSTSLPQPYTGSEPGAVVSHSCPRLVHRDGPHICRPSLGWFLRLWGAKSEGWWAFYQTQVFLPNLSWTEEGGSSVQDRLRPGGEIIQEVTTGSNTAPYRATWLGFVH